MPEAAPSEWERRVVEVLVNIEIPGAPAAAKLAASIPHLVVTGRCECGCPSFFVRDARFEDGDASGSFHYSNAATPAGDVGMFLLLQDDRPWSIDVQLAPEIDPESVSARPDPESLIVSNPYEG